NNIGSPFESFEQRDIAAAIGVVANQRRTLPLVLEIADLCIWQIVSEKVRRFLGGLLVDGYEEANIRPELAVQRQHFRHVDRGGDEGGFHFFFPFTICCFWNSAHSV